MDLYTFTNAPGQTVFFDSLGRDGGAIYWRVTDAVGNQLFNADIYYEQGQFTLPTAGTNLVRAYAPGDAVGKYGFRILAVPAVQTFSISIGDAVSDGVPAVGAGRIESPGAVDLYTFTNAPGQTVFFDSGGRSGGAIYWRLSDDRANPFFSADFGSSDPGKWHFPIAGTNSIRVFGQGDAVGTYAFQLVSTNANGSLTNQPVAKDLFAIQVGDTVTNGIPSSGAGQIEVAGAQDVYMFDGLLGTTVYFDDLGGAYAINWALYDDQGAQLFNDRLDNQDPGAVKLARGGAYTIIVSPAGADPTWIGPYSFRLLAVPPDELFDIAVGVTVTNGVPAIGAGNLAAPGARDQYRFTTDPGATVFFEDRGGAYAINWALYDDQGAQLFNDRLDNQDPGAVKLTRGGAYTIIVSPAGADSTWIGSYSFRLRATPPGSSFAIALGDTISEGVPVGAGRIAKPGERDIYIFEAARGTIAYFEDLEASACCLAWELRDEQGNALYHDRFDGTDPGRYTLSRGGFYNILVTSDGRDPGWIGSYSFRTRVIEPDRAFQIAVGDTIWQDHPAPGAGHVAAAGERDAYTFVAKSGELAYFEDLGASNCCLGWQLFDETGLRVFSDRLDAQDPGSFTLSRGGMYTIEVGSQGADPTWIGPYSFRLWGALPYVFAEPQSARGLSHTKHTFSVTAGSPFPPLLYQWQFNGSDIPGATNSVLVLDDPTTSNAGRYNVRIANTNGWVESEVATLSLGDSHFAVDSSVPTGPVSTNVSQILVQFSEPVASTSISTSDFTVHTPSGVLNTAGLRLARQDARTFLVSIPPQSAKGDYSIEIGPEITSETGARMTGGVLHELYSSEFESGAGSEWSRSGTLTNAITGRFLSSFANDEVTLLLNGLPPHKQARLIWDLAIIDTWEGDASPDFFGFRIGYRLNPAWEHTFHNSGEPSQQSFPLRPDAVGTNLVGSVSPDCIYRDLAFDFEHTNSALAITFYGRNLQGVADESWGLDNVRVFVATSASGIFTAGFRIDKTPPALAEVTPASDIAEPIGFIQWSFTEPIQTTSFTLTDINLTGPLGSVPLNDLVRLDALSYQVTFPTQRVDGVYQLTLGTNLFDLAGNRMSKPVTNSFAIKRPPVTLAVTGPRVLDEQAASNGEWIGVWDASSSDGNQAVYTVEWAFGDGATATGAQARHSYSRPGLYTITATLSDHDYQLAVATYQVVVLANDPPRAEITTGNLAPEGLQPITLSGTASADDHGIAVYRWFLPERHFDFTGRYLDPNLWSTTNAVQDDRLVVTGKDSWSSAWFHSLGFTVGRGGFLQGRVDTPSGTSSAMVGLRNSAGFVYWFHFSDGMVRVPEGGLIPYTKGSSYDFRIETLPGAGALYYLRPSGSDQPFELLFKSTQAATAAFEFGANVYSGVFAFDDFVISGLYHEGTSVRTSNSGVSQMILEVVDHAMQTNRTDITLEPITGEPPVAVIHGPPRAQAGIEIPFDALGSSDDHAIASFTWSFGDGTGPAFGQTVSHTFGAPGVYEVNLEVADFAGQTMSDSLVVTIAEGNRLICVPWRFNGGAELPHETYSGKEISLKAVAREVPVPFVYTWDPGDGSPAVSRIATNAADAFGLELRHIYSASENTPFRASIRIVQTNGAILSDTYPILVRPKTLDVEMNVAIDEGLWYLHKGQTRLDLGDGNEGGFWVPGSHTINGTASAVQAFGINGHLVTDDHSQDPYVATVQRGFNYLLSKLTSFPVSIQPYGDPDSNGNGIAIADGEGLQPYQTGAVMDAFVAAGNPDLVAAVGGTYVKGRTFREIMEDMVDAYSWGQSDALRPGGWRYALNTDSDNSACQWAAIGLIAAERYYGIPIPHWVKEQNLRWLEASCCFGYQGTGDGQATTPSGLIQLAMDGATTLHPLWRTAEAKVTTAWPLTRNNNIYANYAIAKAFRLALPVPVTTLSTGLDWFRDPVDGLARVTLDQQRPDGSWIDGWWQPEPARNTAWSIIILTPSIFQRGPVGVLHVRPNPTAIGHPTVFDARNSFHQHPAFRITEYRWDFNAADGVDFAHPDGFGAVVTNYFAELGTNIITLQVSDNATPPLVGTESAEIRVMFPPHPPTADAAGPYVAAVREDIKFDGGGSFDIDAQQGDALLSWEWELDFESPLDFADGLTGAKAVLQGGFSVAGRHQIGLRVTDRTATVFPAAQKPDLTHEDYTTVHVYSDAITNLTARPKQNKCQLVWSKVGDYAIVMRSRLGPNHGFEEIGRTDSSYATFLDTTVEYNVDYYYRLYAYRTGQVDPLGVSAGVHAISRPLGTNNLAPYFVGSLPRLATVGRVYEVVLEARDPENDPFTFKLLQGPPTMTLVSANGTLRYTPPQDHLGTHLVSVEVANSAGRDVLTYELVVEPLANTPPVAVASWQFLGVGKAQAGTELHFYSAGSRDADGDDLSFTWAFGDGSISDDPNPTHTFLTAGNYRVTLFANDGRGGTTPAFIDVQITRENRAPMANAGTNQLAYVGRSVQLNGTGSMDFDGDPLTFRWSLATRPPGSTSALVNAGSSGPAFTPDKPGVYVVQLAVSDPFEEGQADAVIVSTVNSSPVADAGPDLRVGIGKTAPLDGSLSLDADRDPLSHAWTIVSRPRGSAATLIGANTETPRFTVDVEGAYEIQLVVNDGVASSAPDTILVTTRNLSPSFTSTPSTNAIPRVLWTCPLTAYDPYDTRLSFALVTAPSGMRLLESQINQGGTVRSMLTWTPTLSQLGDHQVVVRVTDSEGAVATQAFVVHVGADIEAPTVSLELVDGSVSNTGQWSVSLGETAKFGVAATDNADGRLGVGSLSLALGPEPVALNDSAHGTVLASKTGLYTLMATARDSAGNLGSTTATVLFYDPNATNEVYVRILSPTNFTTISASAQIVATITNATDLLSYRVDFAPVADVDLSNIAVEGPQFTTLTNVTLPAGTREIKQRVLAEFDPITLVNDDYLIRVVASDGRTLAYEGALLSVSGNLKFGEFHLEFTDLTVPVAGIPITVTRVYDSRDAKHSGDFGHGWRLGIRDAAIRKTLRQGTMFPGSRVYLNTPDGKRSGYTAKVNDASQFGFTFVWIGLQPDPGVYDKLEIIHNVAIFHDGLFVDTLASEPYNPSEFRLTRKDGTIYTYDEHQGLEEIRDMVGNTLVFTTNGISHSSGARIEFVRDSRGRITRIIDPAGNNLTYSYDAEGDLRSFTDQSTNVTQFLYSNARAHFLTNIIDPLGRSAIQAEYDAQGRFVAIKDAAGNRSSQSFDSASKTERFTDANGHVQLVQYDDQGNEVMKAVEGVYTNYFTYDTHNNEISRTDARGFVTTSEYDNYGNLTNIIDALTNVTQITYNEQNRPTSITDAAGHTTRFAYDSKDELVFVGNALGGQASFPRDDQGRITSITDFNDNTTIYEYDGGCSCGKPSKIINPDGTFRLYEYNGLGQTIREVNEPGHETVWEYDGAGRLLSIRDAEGYITRFSYAGNLKISETDPLNRTTLYGYDELNRQIAITNAMGGVVRFQYDKGTNRTAVIDPVGNITRFFYDKANRLSHQVDAWGRTNLFAYDGSGNRIEAVDRNGRKRTFQYDGLNRRTHEHWWEDGKIIRTFEYTFNELGLMTSASDPASHLAFEFDALNRMEQTSQSRVPGLPDFTLTYAYDGMTNVLSVTDNWGVQVASEYDPRNRLSRRVWQGGGLPGASLRFAYDAEGNRTNTLRYADAAGAQLVGQSRYEHNALGAITKILHANGAGTPLAEYQYHRDPAQQITQRLLNGQTAAYDYDLTGQLTNAVYSAGQPNESYRYDANGNRNGEGYLVTTNNQIIADGTFTYGYDAEGSLVARTNSATRATTTYQYDHRNRLLSVVDKNAAGTVNQTVEFTYDTLNRRIAKNVNGILARFLQNEENIWGDADGNGSVTARYLLGNRIDEMFARYWPSRGIDWYLTDNLGTVRDVTDITGANVEHVSFDSFGRFLAHSPPYFVDRFLFTGREWDSETGLYFYRTRFYDPFIGKFTALDPMGCELSEYNLYAYVKNSPIRFVDPTGKMSLTQQGLLISSLALALGTVGFYAGGASGALAGVGAGGAIGLGIAAGSTYGLAAIVIVVAMGVTHLVIQEHLEQLYSLRAPEVFRVIIQLDKIVHDMLRNRRP